MNATTATVTLYDYLTGEDLGEATPAQIAASKGNPHFPFLVARGSHKPLTEWKPGARRVFIEELPPTYQAQPLAGTVRDCWGDPCPAAKTKDCYPLSAKCETCGAEIRCVSGDADWAHKRSGQGWCKP